MAHQDCHRVLRYVTPSPSAWSFQLFWNYIPRTFIKLQLVKALHLTIAKIQKAIFWAGKYIDVDAIASWKPKGIFPK